MLIPNTFVPNPLFMFFKNPSKSDEVNRLEFPLKMFLFTIRKTEGGIDHI
jgi:hypothetical protein